MAIEDFGEVKPRMYLDVDGTLLAHQPLFEVVRNFSNAKYAPEVIKRIGATGMDLVWVSSWGHEITGLLEPEFSELTGGRVLLPPQRLPHKAIRWKAAAVVADQVASPSPFVWADDAMGAPEKKIMRHLFDPRPFLPIIPETLHGIDQADLKRIETFAAHYTPRNK